MNSVRYIGMDVHKGMTVVAVLDATGKLQRRSFRRGWAARPSPAMARPASPLPIK